jgi:hypothetical protein
MSPPGTVDQVLSASQKIAGFGRGAPCKVQSTMKLRAQSLPHADKLRNRLTANQRQRFLEISPGSTISNPCESSFDFESFPWKLPCFGSCALP